MQPRRRDRRAAAAVLGSALFAGLTTAAIVSSHAEPIADDRPTHVTLGGASHTTGALPRGSLRIGWRAHLPGALVGPAVVHPGEPMAIADATGTLFFLGTDGSSDPTSAAPSEHHVMVSSQGTSPPFRLTDGTIVTVSGAGEAVGYRGGELRFRAPLGTRTQSSARGKRPIAQLALDDGGFALAVDNELFALDASGVMRAQVVAPDRVTSDFAVLGDQLAVVTSAGLVLLWRPGGELRSGGELGGRASGIVGSGRTITAIDDGTRLVDLDVVTHERRTRDEVRGAAVFSGAVVRSGHDLSVAEVDGANLSLLTYGTYGPQPPSAGQSSGGGSSEPPPRRTTLVTRASAIASSPASTVAASGTLVTGPAARGGRGLTSDAGSPARPVLGANAPPSVSSSPRAAAAASPPDVVELVADGGGRFAFALTPSAAGASPVIGVVDPARGERVTFDGQLCSGGDIAGLALGTDALVVTCTRGDVLALVR